MSGSVFQFVKAVYPYSAQNQEQVSLCFNEAAVIEVAERLDDGWCRGYVSGKEGWFPASYTQTFTVKSAIEPHQLSAVLHSSEWGAYATTDDKIYFVNLTDRSTTWSVPNLKPPVSPTTPPPVSPKSPLATAANGKPLAQAPVVRRNKQGDEAAKHTKRTSSISQPSKPRLITVNGLTFADGGPQLPLLQPNTLSYVDYFWSDKLDKSGFDLILSKHCNGKTVLKDVIDFTKERAVIEETYAKSLMKLSKSMLGSQEEGSLLQSWHTVKMELATRANIHSGFSSQLTKDFNQEIFDFKESQKKDRKQHEMLITQDRKQLTQLDANIEKAKQSLVTKQKDIESKKLARKASLKDVEVAKRKSSYASEELKRCEEVYNVSQRKWVDNMISACQDLEEHEEERSKFLQGMFYKYVDLHIGMHEKSAESLSAVTGAVDKINPKSDRERFIKQYSTGTQRPEDRR